MRKSVLLLLIVGLSFFSFGLMKSYAACTTIGDSCTTSASCSNGSTECGIVSCINKVCASTTTQTQPVLTTSDTKPAPDDYFYVSLNPAVANTTYEFDLKDIDDKVITYYTASIDSNGNCGSSSSYHLKDLSATQNPWINITCGPGYINIGLRLGNLGDSYIRSDTTTSLKVSIKGTDLVAPIFVTHPPPKVVTTTPAPDTCSSSYNQGEDGACNQCYAMNLLPSGQIPPYNSCKADGTTKNEEMICQIHDSRNGSGCWVSKESASSLTLTVPLYAEVNEPFTASVTSCAGTTAQFQQTDQGGDSNTVPIAGLHDVGPPVTVTNESASQDFTITTPGLILIQVNCNGILASSTVDVGELQPLITVPPPPPNCTEPDIKTGECLSIETALGILKIGDLPQITKTMFTVLLSISGAIILLIIIRSGYLLMFSQGNAEKVKEAQDRLTSAFVGFLFLLFSLVILQVIGVDILHIPGFSK